MGEEVDAALRPHQMMRDQPAAIVARLLDQVPERRELETLADRRGRLERRLVRPQQPVHARQHQALDRGRHRLPRTLLGVAQQLLQEQRIALGAGDAVAHDPFVDLE